MEVGFRRGASLQWRLGCDFPVVDCSESISLGAEFCVSSFRYAFNTLICEMMCTRVGVVVVFFMGCLFLLWDISDFDIFKPSRSAFGRSFGSRVVSTMGICVFFYFKWCGNSSGNLWEFIIGKVLFGLLWRIYLKCCEK